MSKLAEYEEVIEYRVVGGYRFMLPSELDKAVRRMNIAELEAALLRLEAEPKPKEVELAERAMDKATGKAYDRLLAKVQAWEERRLTERRSIEAALHRERRTLQQMEETAGGAGDVERVTYYLREFSHGERMSAEDKHAEVDPDTLERRVNLRERNLDLLETVLARVSNGKNDVQPAPPVRELPDRVATVLIDRMWARNQMDPALAPYFR